MSRHEPDPGILLILAYLFFIFAVLTALSVAGLL
jgi:hypothetical protein